MRAACRLPCGRYWLIQSVHDCNGKQCKYPPPSLSHMALQCGGRYSVSVRASVGGCICVCLCTCVSASFEASGPFCVPRLAWDVDGIGRFDLPKCSAVTHMLHSLEALRAVDGAETEWFSSHPAPSGVCPDQPRAAAPPSCSGAPLSSLSLSPLYLFLLLLPFPSSPPLSYNPLLPLLLSPLQ